MHSVAKIDMHTKHASSTDNAKWPLLRGVILLTLGPLLQSAVIRHQAEISAYNPVFSNFRDIFVLLRIQFAQ